MGLLERLGRLERGDGDGRREFVLRARGARLGEREGREVGCVSRFVGDERGGRVAGRDFGRARFDDERGCGVFGCLEPAFGLR
ncbi:MAG: hypothetical protein V3V08_03305 [Nannocystaceae bacterium]